MTNRNLNITNEVHQQAKENYLQLEREYYDLLETKHQLEQDKQHPLLGKINIRLQQLDARLKRNEASEKYYPIKDYLLENSYLVQFKEKEASGKSLSKAEKAKQERIYDLRDKVFSNIKKELVKYYQAVIKGDYRFAGMPEIKGGIRDWAEAKIWHLLVRLGEPNHFCDLDKTNDFWAES
jgi:transposase